MTKNIQNSIQSFVDDADSFITSIIEEIDRVKHALEKGYELDTAEIPKERFFEDIGRLMIVSDHMKAAENLLDKINILQLEYQPLSQEMRTRYADFLTAGTIEELDELEAYPTAMQEMLVAENLMIHAMRNVEDPIEQANLLYTGLVKVSDTVEKYFKYFTPQARENVRRIARSFLDDPAYNPENYRGQTNIESCMIALKNTARAVLWQVDQYQEEAKSTVEGILDWLKTSPGWSGDDFDDCLDYRQIITIESGKRSGKPCIRGMRITVYDILEYLAGGMTQEEILEDFSELTSEDIKACLAFAADREKKLFVASL